MHISKGENPKTYAKWLLSDRVMRGKVWRQITGSVGKQKLLRVQHGFIGFIIVQRIGFQHDSGEDTQEQTSESEMSPGCGKEQTKVGGQGESNAFRKIDWMILRRVGSDTAFIIYKPYSWVTMEETSSIS